MKKIILITATIIIGGGIGGYLVFKTPSLQKPSKCPQYAPPAPSFYEDCKRRSGTVTPGGKDNRGCQTHPRCVFAGKLNLKVVSLTWRLNRQAI